MSLHAPPPDLNIRIIPEADAVVLCLEGELDLGSAPDLTRAIDAAAQRTRRLVVDMSGVPFMDSSGLAALARASRAAEIADRELRLRRPQANLRRLLELTGMLDSFVIED